MPMNFNAWNSALGKHPMVVMRFLMRLRVGVERVAYSY